MIVERASSADVDEILRMALGPTIKGWILSRSEVEVKGLVEKGEILVKRDKGRILGYAACSLGSNKPEIHFVVSERPFVISCLIKAWIEVLTKKGYGFVFLTTRADNPLIKTVFKRCGFAHLPLRQLPFQKRVAILWRRVFHGRYSIALGQILNG